MEKEIFKKIFKPIYSKEEVFDVLKNCSESLMGTWFILEFIRHAIETNPEVGVAIKENIQNFPALAKELLMVPITDWEPREITHDLVLTAFRRFHKKIQTYEFYVTPPNLAAIYEKLDIEEIKSMVHIIAEYEDAKIKAQTLRTLLSHGFYEEVEKFLSHFNFSIEAEMEKFKDTLHTALLPEEKDIIAQLLIKTWNFSQIKDRLSMFAKSFPRGIFISLVTSMTIPSESSTATALLKLIKNEHISKRELDLIDRSSHADSLIPVLSWTQVIRLLNILKKHKKARRVFLVDCGIALTNRVANNPRFADMVITWFRKLNLHTIVFNATVTLPDRTLQKLNKRNLTWVINSFWKIKCSESGAKIIYKRLTPMVVASPDKMAKLEIENIPS